MRVVLQRVSEAAVSVGGESVASIGPGFLALVGVEVGDTVRDAHALATKVAGLRVFADGDGRFNVALSDIRGSVLVVSQFTLLADVRRGRRPSFSRAAAPPDAEPLVDRFASDLRDAGMEVSTGVFGATMQVSLINDGPVTLVIDASDGNVT